MPVHRRPLELRLHLLREGAYLLRVDREPARPPGGHPRQAQQDHPGAARRRRAPPDQGARQEAGRDPGQDDGDHAGGPRALHAGADRGVGVLPVHLDPGDVQLRGGHPPRAPGFPRLDQPGVAVARGGAARRRVEPDREEDSVVRPDLRRGQGSARDQRGEAHRHPGADPAPARRLARREPGDRRLGARRVRDRQGAVRAGHRRARRGAPQSRDRLLQDRHAGRSGARVPARGRAAARRGQCALLHGARGAAPGALARSDGSAAARGGEGWRAAGGVPQPGVRLRAVGATRRGGGGVRRGGGPRQDRSQNLSRLGRRGLEARRRRRRGGAAGPRPGAVRPGAAPGVVLGPRARRRERRRVPARRAAGPRGRGGLPLPRRAAEQPRRAAGAGRRPGGRGGPDSRGAQGRALPAAALQEPRRSRLPRVALRRSVGRLQPRGRARARPRGRRLLQARQHRVQAERPRPGGSAVAQGAGDQSQARARQGQSGYVERAVVTAEQDERAFRALTQKITRARGLACDAYKDRCLRRRIGVRMRARGVHTFADYGRVLDADAREYDLLLDALTINVTKFFRNVETWRALAPRLEALWRERQGRVRAWSAGCASGEEPYTVAIALAEAARATGQDALLARARVDATDIDRASLERTRAAEFAEATFSEMPAELVRRYFTAEAPRRPLPELQGLVHVAKHDLTTEPPPDPPYDLIVCRNVVIYFDRPMQERLFAQFAAALSPGGILLLGKVETLFGPARDRLVLEEPRERIYRRSEA